MRMIVCDRCNGHVDNESRLTTLVVDRPNEKDYNKELCGSCAAEFKRFIDTPPPQAARAA